jgi:hypothetical protein
VSVSPKDRPVTPFAPFDARPKVSASGPVDPFSGIPRAPRMPSGIEPAATEYRDTDPTDLTSGDHEVPESAKTPLESPYSLKAVSHKLDEVLVSARSAANESIATRGELRTLTEALQALARRVTALEVSGRWAPLIISSIAIIGMLWMAFQMQRMQLQIQALLH